MGVKKMMLSKVKAIDYEKLNKLATDIATRNNKTKETMFQLKTDYPGVTFNSGNAIVATNGKQYDRDARKRNGIGISIGPSVGYYYFFLIQSFKPAVGISVTIGYTFTPKAFQW